MQAEPQVPVTVLTGFLGAGKTTLLNRILKEQHGHRIAVIENEFGPEGIDNEILVEETREQIVEMNNGCICCTVRGDLVRILDELKTKREASRRTTCWTRSSPWSMPSTVTTRSMRSPRRRTRWALPTAF